MSLEEKYTALQAKTVLLVQKYREQEAARAEAEATLQAKEQLVSLLTSEREKERAEAAARQHELEAKLAAAERRARAAELREDDRLARLQVVLAKLRGRHEADSEESGEEGVAETAAGAADDSGTEDSSETTGQSDSGDEEEEGAPRAPARPAWMEEARTAEEAQQRRLTSPETRRKAGNSDKKKQLQGMLRRGAVFKENSKDKLVAAGSPSPPPVPHLIATSPRANSAPAVPVPASGTPTSGNAVPPGAPLSPKKKKGHLELNTIIAALTPKNRRKEDSSSNIAELPKSPRSATVTRLGRSRSTDRSPFLRRKPAGEGLAASGSTGNLNSSGSVNNGGVTPRRPPTLEGELLIERQTHDFKALEITVYQAVNLEELGGKSVRVETDPAMPWPLRTRAVQVTDEAAGVVFSDEWTILGDRRATSFKGPLVARLVAADGRGREDLAGLLELPIQETEWGDATWTSMRWLPVAGVLGEVRGLVQVILRRTTIRSERQFVSAAATQAAVSQLLAHSLAASVRLQLAAPPVPEAPESRSSSSGTLSPVQRAMESRDLEGLARELEGGAHFEPEWRNAARQTVLHLLAAGGRAALCRLVLTLGAKVGAVDGAGNTPLHLACHFGHWDAALLLLARGADVAALNGNSASPLLLALLANQLPPPELFRQLLSPAVASARADGGLTLLHAIVRLAPFFSLAQIADLTRQIISAGCPPDLADDDGCSPALMWCLVAPIAGAEVFFEALNLDFAEKKAVWLRAEQRGDTPLWRLLATEPDEARAVELLKVCDVDRRYGLHGNTLLHRCCMSLPPDRCVKIGMLLLDTRPELDATAANLSHRHTALHLLCARGDDALVPLARRLLEDHKADPNGKDGAGRGPLHYCGSPGMARLLLVHGAKIDASDSFGNTVLHAAHAWGGLPLVDLLLAALKRDDPPALRQGNAEGLVPGQLVGARHKMVCSPFYPSDPALRRTGGTYWEPAPERPKE